MGEIIQNAANVAAAAQWPDTVSRYGMRGLFHALCDLDGTDPGPVLDHAVTRPWMAEAARRLSTLAVLDRTRPAQPGDRELTDTLYLLHAASRVRDILLLAHQPPPLDPAGLTSLDEALGRTPPSFGPVPVSRIAAFFARLGCRPVTEPSFDPVLHEIIACEPAASPDAPVQVTAQAWPALLIGELVFARAGVAVRAGAAHAVPGVADRSLLHWEYWRRHRPTSDGSRTSSQWRTQFRRDYRTPRGAVYNLDAWPPDPAPPPASAILPPADAAELVRNRCLLRAEPHGPYQLPDVTLDERR